MWLGWPSQARLPTQRAITVKKLRLPAQSDVSACVRSCSVQAEHVRFSAHDTFIEDTGAVHVGKSQAHSKPLSDVADAQIVTCPLG